MLMFNNSGNKSNESICEMSSEGLWWRQTCEEECEAQFSWKYVREEEKEEQKWTSFFAWMFYVYPSNV